MLVPLSTWAARRRSPPAMPPRGFTLIEVMITLVILAVLLAIAVPSMQQFIARKRVEGVAQELATDLRYLRAQQIQRSAPVRIRFGSTDAMTCYVMYVWGAAGINCNCTRTDGPVCGNPDAPGASQELKTVVLPRSGGVVLSSNPALLTLLGFNGLPDGNATLLTSVSSSRGGEVRVTTNLSAKPSLCSVSGSESTIPRCAP